LTRKIWNHSCLAPVIAEEAAAGFHLLEAAGIVTISEHLSRGGNWKKQRRT
jgi:hypothetical protein